MKRRIKKKNDESEINITPMLDIVFIMLIFFIVTTSFVKEISIDVNRPTKSPIKEQKKSDVISVRILDSGQILIQERLISIDAVRANIERLHAENPEAPVIIQPHPDSTTAVMIHIMDSARLAGVYNVSLAAAN